MKKTQVIELLNSIKKTKVSFLSIAFFVMLGAAAYLGIDWSVKAFVNKVDNTLTTYEFQDVEIKHPYGLDDEYINVLSKENDNYLIEGEYSSYQYFKKDNILIQAKVTSLTNKVNVITDFEGTLPTTNKECAIERFYANTKGIKIGDEITFIHDDDGYSYQLNAVINNDLDSLKEGKKVTKDGMSYLKNDTFLVTALVESPEHIGKYKVQQEVSSNETNVDVVIYVTRDAFDLDAIPGYTKVLLTENSLRKYDSVSNKYLEENDNLIEQIKAYSNGYVNDKNKKVVSNKDSLLKGITDELEKGNDTILNGKKEIASAEEKIEKGKIELANNKRALINGRTELDNARKEYDAALIEYNLSKGVYDISKKACAALEEAIEIYRYVGDNRDNIEQQIQSLKLLYDMTMMLISYDLPETYYVVSQMEVFFNNLNNDPSYRTEIGEYVDQYNLFVEQIKSDPNFPTREEVNLELDNAIANETSIENIEKLNELKIKINEIYDDLELYEVLPSALLGAFDMLKELNMLEEVEGDILKKINLELRSRDIPTLKELVGKIDDIIQDGYENYDDIKSDVTELYEYLSQYIDDIEIALEEEIKPLLRETNNTLKETKRELDSALIELNKGEETISNGWIEYNRGLKLLNDSQLELDEAKAKLSDLEKEVLEGSELYNKFVEATKDIKDYDATIIGRQSNYSVITSKIVADIISKLKLTLGLLFVIVGILVSYSAMSRLVYNQTKEIGTKKALGLKQKEITLSFMMYSLIATIIGSLLGIAFSVFIIEPVVTAILADSFNLSSFEHYFGLKSYLIFTLVEIAVTLCAAYFATHSLLKRNAVKLLNENKELVGKTRFFEKSKLWNKLSLLTKTIINNIFNDKRRVVGTLVGIIGCATLLVCAMTFKNNIDKSILREINVLSSFDTVITIDNGKENAEEDITKKLDDLNIEYTSAVYKSGLLKSENDEYVMGFVYSANDDELYDYSIQLSNGNEIKPTSGAIVSESFCKFNNINVGDDITFIDLRGNEHILSVEGIAENYLFSADIYIDNNLYENEFNEKIKNNLIYLRRNDKSIDEITNEICNCDSFVSIEDFKESVYDGMRALTSTANIMFEIFLALSVGLAFLVILNLLVVYIDEKKKELIVLMINGYDRKYAKKYIYTDTIFLTIIGIIIGSIFGTIVGNAATRTFNTSSSIFMTKLFPSTFIIAALITLVLCTINAIIALRRIDKYRLVDINSK